MCESCGAASPDALVRFFRLECCSFFRLSAQTEAASPGRSSETVRGVWGERRCRGRQYPLPSPSSLAPPQTAYPPSDVGDGLQTSTHTSLNHRRRASPRSALLLDGLGCEWVRRSPSASFALPRQTLAAYALLYADGLFALNFSFMEQNPSGQRDSSPASWRRRAVFKHEVYDRERVLLVWGIPFRPGWQPWPFFLKGLRPKNTEDGRQNQLGEKDRRREKRNVVDKW